MVRAGAAALAAALVAADALSAGAGRPWARRATAAGLAACAVAAVLAYARFGEPQFRDEASGRPTPVHLWDMSVYFPTAKYFDELGYGGLYLADAATLAENHGAPPGAVPGGLVIRDLTSGRLVRAHDVAGDVAAARARFSPARWQAFRRDAAYFEGALGTLTYLHSLRDHGANATPVWMLLPHLLFRTAPAGERWLSLTALVDPLLLLIMFVAIGRAYGARAALVAVIVWGTTSFSAFGTNLLGSTLRADWLAALGTGAAALRSRRRAVQAAGGALIALAALLRAFPALAVAFLAVPALWALTGRRPSPRRAGPALAGAAAAALVLFAATGATFSFSRAWGGWAERIGRHAAEPSPNHVGLRAIASFDAGATEARLAEAGAADVPAAWEEAQRRTFERRKPAFLVAAALLVGAALLACRRLRLDQAALVGMMLVPVVAYPANYYLHYVFLLPLLAAPDADAGPDPRARRRFAAVAGVILAMSVAQVPLFHRPWDVSFFRQSVLLLAAFAAIGALMSSRFCRRSPRSEGPASRPA